MKNMKKTFEFIIIMFIAFLLCVTSISAFDIPQKTDLEYINDYANVISSAKRTELAKNAKDFYEKYEVKLVFSTIDDKDVETASVAEKMYNEWELGRENDDKSILVLFNKAKKDTHAEVGKGISYIINSTEASYYIVNSMDGYIRQNNFQGAIVNGQKTFMKYIEDKVNPSKPTEEKTEETNEADEEVLINKGMFIIVKISGIVAFLIILLIAYRTFKPRKKKD